MQDLQCWYKALELEPGASLEEVNQAHRDLALVWHPDRLPKDMPRLQEKAHAKLQEINNARDRLREYTATQSNGKATSTSNGSTVTRSTRQTAYQQRTQPRRTPPRQEEPQKAQPQPEPQQTVTKSNGVAGAASAQATRETNRHHKAKTPARTPYQRPDLSGVDWSDTDLSERDLSSRNLTNANLSNTDLQDSFLHGTNLQGANLQKANLFRANLLQANLSGANLRGANLIGADLSGADLSNADMTGAKIKVGTKIMVRLMGANLAGTIMPDGQVHL